MTICIFWFTRQSSVVSENRIITRACLVILKKELYQQNHDTGEINKCGKARKLMYSRISWEPKALSPKTILPSRETFPSKGIASLLS